MVASDAGAETHFDAPDFAIRWQPGTRRIASLEATLAPGKTLKLTPQGADFAMSGLGYAHPEWGHGRDHGPEVRVLADVMHSADRVWGVPLAMHVQALVTAVLTDGGVSHRGVGVLEQLFVGPHAPTGLVGLMEPAA